MKKNLTQPEMNTNSVNIANHFKVHVVNLLNEVLQSNDNMKVMKIPFKTLAMILGKAAERAAELKDDAMIGYFCRLAIYTFSDPEGEDYDKTRTEKYINATK